MTWYLFILLSCGSGCLEVRAVPFDTRVACEFHETVRSKCEVRVDA